MNLKKTIPTTWMLPAAMLALVMLLPMMAHAAAPGITGPTFNLVAHDSYLNQPDGSSVYAWGYGCSGTPAGWAPAAITVHFCNTSQVPGPTLIVTEGQKVTVNLTNNLPTAAGNTSILFPGFQVCTGALSGTTCTPSSTDGVAGLMTQEAAPGGSVTYTFIATTPGTRAYYSGTQSDFQVEMGMYGAIIVLPANVPAVCTAGLPVTNPGNNAAAKSKWGEADFRLADSAYDHDKTCYDREYLFQFAEMDGNVHKAALAQINDPVRIAACAISATTPGCGLEVPTEPFHPNYFVINGRSMPDDMDPNYAVEYPHQPYNGNPHAHPGEIVLLRVIGQGRWQHPFHEHANHVRILARDGNLILSQGNSEDLAGPPLFTTTTTPGLAMDGLFTVTGRGLNWDMYGHSPTAANPDSLGNNPDPPCTPDVNGFNTGAPTAINYYEWCADHNKPLQVAPFGDVAAGGPATLPDPDIFTNGVWYSGSPYLGPDATTRATGPTSSFLPANAQGNPSNERGWAFMWHSHNEREITTNNSFPGGMLMMLLEDSREFVIDESN
jgi:FtsP/CotA-like multicopper oxidase with cupredoxin domain